MQRFMIYTEDKNGGAQLRENNRAAHLTHIQAGGEVTVLAAGPWLSDDEHIMLGSLLIVEAHDLKTVRDWAQKDPYVKAGLTARAQIHPFLWVLGAP